jgi:hypothetical protein
MVLKQAAGGSCPGGASTLSFFAFLRLSAVSSLMRVLDRLRSSIAVYDQLQGAEFRLLSADYLP